ncbi:MAG: hypothetical protein MJ180_03245 [Candidatus Gastranaerophilales bacterium]|nr:hypothetical protein [Candidatus Gastranaerophilales bacterium]
MNSSSKRIQSNSVQYGSSFVLSSETEEENFNNLTSQKNMLQKEIEKKKAELQELQNSLKELFEQKDSIIDKAKKSAEDITNKANKNAEEIINNANREKDKIANDAQASGQKQGFEAGYNSGQEQFKLDYEKQIKALNVLANATFAVKNEIVYSSETEILELALMIAEKVVRVKFDNDIEAFKNMTQTAISLLKEKENIKIVVNPKLIEYAQEISQDLSEQLENLDQIKIVQDKAVSPDGVVVESVDSRIDARISTQMETLARTLLIDKREHEVVTEEIENKIKEKTEKVISDD